MKAYESMFLRDEEQNLDRRLEIQRALRVIDEILPKASPAVLDLFMWLSYRCFTARGVESIPLFRDFGLANQIGTTDYSRPGRFRAMVEQWLDSIRRHSA